MQPLVYPFCLVLPIWAYWKLCGIIAKQTWQSNSQLLTKVRPIYLKTMTQTTNYIHVASSGRMDVQS